MPYKDPEKKKQNDLERAKRADYREKERLRSLARRLVDPERNRAHQKKWRDENKPQFREAIEAWRDRNKDRVSEKNAEWRLNNTARIKQVDAQYRLVNKTRIKAKQKEYVKNNPGKVNACTARRNAQRLMATPPWADLKKIIEFYDEAARLSRETGVPHEVDHIIPLRGKAVCGLHVHWNLQILTRAANRSKSNSL